MIVAFAPFRISLAGGGCDYAEFYTKFGCLIIGFTINLGVYVTLRETPEILDYKFLINYSQSEKVDKVSDIKHNGVRGCLEYLKLTNVGLEISCLCDLPSRTGIGSSSSFIVALLKCLPWGVNPTKKDLADLAIDIERKYLAEPGGKQDSIHSSFGGFNSIRINEYGDYRVRPIPVSQEFLKEFKRWSLLLYLGESRDSFDIAASHNEKKTEEYKLRILDLAYSMYDAFTQEDLNRISNILYDSWEAKRLVSSKISNPKIDDNVAKIIECGGKCKLLGSGGSGFLYVLAPPENHQAILKETGLKNVNWDFDWNGANIIYA